MTVLPSTNTQIEKQGIILAIMAVTFFSSSPILVRWAEPLSAYEITFWRVFVAALAVGGVLIVQKDWPKIEIRNVPKFLMFGFITAIHFWAYAASLNYTSIAHSLTIVYTAPVFVALLSNLFLKEPITARKWLGIMVVIIGIAILAGFEAQMTYEILWGDVLALISAIAFGFYSVMGRSQRQAYPLLTYAFFIYLLAALWLAPLALSSATPSGYGTRQILSLLALGIVPLGLGHTLYNAALRHMNATYVNLITSQEITGGVILGIIFFSEFPEPNAILGAIITIIGIVIVMLA